MHKHLLLISLFILTTYVGFSQKNEPFVQRTSLGLQFSPILSNQLIRNDNISFREKKVDYEVTLKPSYIFGMEIKHDFTKNFSMETGLNFVKRNYDINITTHDSTNYIQNSTLKFIGYEIPVLGLVFIRIADDIYMHNAFGICTNFYPSDIVTADKITVLGRRAGSVTFMQTSLLANVGFEYRTKENGTFYIGGTYQYHFKDMLQIEFHDEDIFGSPDAKTTISGNYFVLNLKYYFPQNNY